MQKHTAHTPGFTIIELLIVIAVIAILATLSFAAYTGMQTRAENTKTSQAIAEYAKVIKMYADSNGVYPTSVTPPTTPPNDNWNCLPYELNSCGDTTSDLPSCLGLNHTTQNANFKANLLTIVTSLPSVSTQEIKCANNHAVKGAYLRTYNSGTSATLHFFQNGDVNCPSIGGTQAVSSTLSGNAKHCTVALPQI